MKNVTSNKRVVNQSTNLTLAEVWDAICSAANAASGFGW